MSLEDYEPVAERLVKFWAAHPDGRIVNELVTFEGDRCIVRSSIYFHKDDPHPVAVDFAEEIRGSSNVNRQAHIENCSTSATGRALSLCGFASATDGSGAGWQKKPSREEMQKVTRMREATVTQPAKQQFDGIKTIPNKFKAKCSLCGVMMAAETGLAINDGSGWVNKHKDGECNPEEPF
jgi:hypothetical protein